jgi:hypothetical protein
VARATISPNPVANTERSLTKMGKSVQVLARLYQTFVMVLGGSSRVEGAFERLRFLSKSMGEQF